MPQHGDLVFQSLEGGGLVAAIEGVTESPLSHCGIVMVDGDQVQVIEAFSSVEITPWAEFVLRGEQEAFTVYRCAQLTEEQRQDFVTAARSYLGRPYDIHYAFDNREIYCSELIYLAWQQTCDGELAAPETLGSLNWEPHEAFIRTIERGGLPLEREMITPVALTRSPQLEQVYRYGEFLP